MEVLERLSNLPKMCDLNSGDLTQETTLNHNTVVLRVSLSWRLLLSNR